ncbi:MAG: 4Fe-4S dicluster domain-containing protein [Candidatus Latescibacteria bacterium]|nr:4Fe-4S dicluster domain-containing protein [Candidatus Latescibacterota bacterium]
MNDVVARVRAAGVVGAGGAGFPTHVKLSGRARWAIANGAECEPLLESDRGLMTARADEIVRGLEYVASAVGAERKVIAIKEAYTEAIRALETASKGSGIEFHLLGSYYPAGDEQEIVLSVTGQAVPEGGIPLDVGAVVCNVETLLNIRRAMDGEPVVDTVLTVAGAVRNPISLTVPIGASLNDVIALAGGATEENCFALLGGAMMGAVVEDFSNPVTKTTNAILVLPSDHPLKGRKDLPFSTVLRQDRSACTQCRQCTDMCPRYLSGHRIEPHRIMRALSYPLSTDAEVMAGALLCSECGCCELYACPMGLAPKQACAWMKAELTRLDVKPEWGKEPLRPPAEEKTWRRIPVGRLTARLGLAPYDRGAPLTEVQAHVDRVSIPLKQHIGAPAQPIVRIGDRVRRGDVIAEIPENALGARVHASLSGRVSDVDDVIVIVRD